MDNIVSYKDFIEEKKNPCWKGYKQIGTKNKKGRIVPNCVKINESESEFDRVGFYLDYYKEISPQGFVVTRYGDSIVIDI